MANFKVECSSAPEHWKGDEKYASVQKWNINNRYDADDQIEHLKSVHRKNKSMRVLITLNDKTVFEYDKTKTLKNI